MKPGYISFIIGIFLHWKCENENMKYRRILIENYLCTDTW